MNLGGAVYLLLEEQLTFRWQLLSLFKIFLSLLLSSGKGLLKTFPRLLMPPVLIVSKDGENVSVLLLQMHCLALCCSNADHKSLGYCL